MDQGLRGLKVMGWLLERLKPVVGVRKAESKAIDNFEKAAKHNFSKSRRAIIYGVDNERREWFNRPKAGSNHAQREWFITWQAIH